MVVTLNMYDDRVVCSAKVLLCCRHHFLSFEANRAQSVLEESPEIDEDTNQMASVPHAEVKTAGITCQVCWVATCPISIAF